MTAAAGAREVRRAFADYVLFLSFADLREDISSSSMYGLLVLSAHLNVARR
jgi:hypothetical protein